MLLLLAAGFGAAHALTPGHGKTLVAAYLVGERGTAWHALLLGLVTTVTHTAAVLVVAAVLPLLLRRRAAGGRANGVRPRRRAAHRRAGPLACSTVRRPDTPTTSISARRHTPPPTGRRPGGGLVGPGHARHQRRHHPLLGRHRHARPGDRAQRLWLGLPLLLAFSAGLAGVLIALGIGVVYARNLAGHASTAGSRSSSPCLSLARPSSPCSAWDCATTACANRRVHLYARCTTGPASAFSPRHRRYNRDFLLALTARSGGDPATPLFLSGRVCET